MSNANEVTVRQYRREHSAVTSLFELQIHHLSVALLIQQIPKSNLPQANHADTVKIIR
ncbi:hypothetical protein ACLPJF_21365 [Pseudomonas vlassakiae]|uniref:hypothetical protein n=1 Tax=Pseudomonas TaxID=286 RepID=UPI001C25446E|nr:hypothetical protein [Pseudomonas shirazica]